MVFKILFYVALSSLLSSCSFLMIGAHPKASSYKYYNKNFKLLPNDALKTHGFYLCKYRDKIHGNDYYSYLRFYDDGRINSLTTKAKPELIEEERSWRFNNVYGYYKFEGDNIAYELKSRYGTYEHGEGIVESDTLKLKIFDRRSNGDTTYIGTYIFHPGFAK